MAGRIILFTLLVLLSRHKASAQGYDISGKIVAGSEPAIGAVVTVMGPDSSFRKGVAADLDGRFVLSQVDPGNYILKFSFISYKDQYRNITLSSKMDLGTVSLKQDLKQLEEVEVNTQAVAATQNGDTSSLNARAFKVNRDASAEDLVGKMPGITMQEGKVQAQGEDVQQVLVDGQTFFGDDAAAVLKNLPAEVIDKVQVFDRKSEQAQFTGFDDGNTQKTINIVTKVEFRNGVFGRAYGGYGTDSRYRAGAVVNRFKDKQRFTLMLMSNNVNEQNFSSEDLIGVSGGTNRSAQSGGPRGGRGGRGRGGFSDQSDNFLVDIRNGISSTNAAGLNYSDQWGSKTTVNASYLFNQTINRAQTDLLRQYVVGSNTGLNYGEESSARSDNYNHRLNMRIETKLDSMRSLLFRPRISMQLNNGNSQLSGVNSSAEGVLSTISNQFASDLQAVNLRVPMQYRHKFAKRGRTISVELEPEYNSSGGNNTLKTFNRFFADSSEADTLDQRADLSTGSYGGEIELTYTEPLGEKSALSLNYESNLSESSSEKNTMRMQPGENAYTLRDSLLSSTFSNRYVSHAAGPGYRYNNGKLSAGGWVMVQQAELSRKEYFPGNVNAERDFRSVVSRVFMRYNISKDRNFRLYYRSSNEAPKIEQMQDVVNNNNSLQLTTGNPGLGQTFNSRFVARYSATNTQKLTSFFAMIGGNYVDNYIGNSTIIAGSDTVVLNGIYLPKGSQITRPVNLDGQYSLRSFINYTFPLKKLKSNLNLNLSLNHNHVPALVNDRVNYSDNSSAGAGFVLSSNISERADFTLSFDPRYNLVSNSLQQDLNTSYYTQNSRLRLSFMPTDWLQVQADYSNTIYRGLAGGFNQNISLLNGSLAWKLLKDRRSELRLYVFDILGQNNSIQRTASETYIEDVETSMLQRYFMLSFTYNFRHFPGSR